LVPQAPRPREASRLREPWERRWRPAWGLLSAQALLSAQPLRPA
jgi:hypothetical protein